MFEQTTTAAEQAKDSEHKLDAENEEKLVRVLKEKKAKKIMKLKAFNSVSRIAMTFSLTRPKLLNIFSPQASSTVTASEYGSVAKRVHDFKHTVEESNHKITKLSDYISEVKSDIKDF